MLRATTILLLPLAVAILPLPQDEKAKKEGIPYEGSVITSVMVKDMKAAKAFYSEVLGFKVFYEYTEGGWCEMTTPVKNAMIGLQAASDQQKFIANGGAGIGLGVTDMAAAKAVLEKHKTKLKTEIIEIPMTVKLLYFFDPDGNTLYFYEPYKAPASK